MNDHELDVLIKQSGVRKPQASVQLVNKARLKASKKEKQRELIEQVGILLMIMFINLIMMGTIGLWVGKLMGINLMVCTGIVGIILLISTPIIYLITYLLLTQERNKRFVKGEDRLC